MDAVSFFLMSVRRPKSSTTSPWVTSVEWMRSLTSSPFLTVISFGAKANRLAVMVISLGACVAPGAAHTASAAKEILVISIVWSFIEGALFALSCCNQIDIGRCSCNELNPIVSLALCCHGEVKLKSPSCLPTSEKVRIAPRIVRMSTRPLVRISPFAHPRLDLKFRH